MQVQKKYVYIYIYTIENPDESDDKRHMKMANLIPRTLIDKVNLKIKCKELIISLIGD